MNERSIYLCGVILLRMTYDSLRFTGRNNAIFLAACLLWIAVLRSFGRQARKRRLVDRSPQENGIAVSGLKFKGIRNDTTAAYESEKSRFCHIGV